MVALLLGAATMVSWSDSHAVPAFARQTGMACLACHQQSYPALSAFGRAFKAGGYTMTGTQPLVSGDDLSLPSVLNASMVLKVRHQKTNGDDDTVATNTGEFQFPDEAALLIGGRVGDHAGFLLEFGMGTDTSIFASFKMPFTFQVDAANLAVIPFTTDALGAGYGMELLNTGALRSQRVGEDRSAMMAQQYLGLGSGAAEGFAFVAAHPAGFINLSLWSPTHGTNTIKTFAPYLRAALTPRLGDWDTGFGVQYFSGKATTVDDTGADEDHVTKGWAVDAQVQGMAGAFPLGVYAAYGKVPSETDNIFNSSGFDRTAWSVHGQLGIVPNRVTLLLGFRSADRGTPTGDEDNATTVGATYQFAQNVQFQLNHVMFSGNRYDPKPASGDARTTLMLFSAF
jgi:hypothetical protein